MEKVLAAGGLVINQNNELLMIFKRGKWDLPKGHIDKNETFESCAVREVKEETGLSDVGVIRFIGITEHEYYDSQLKADARKETHWFEMQANKSEPLIPQLEESIEWIKWIPQNEIKNYLKNSYGNISNIIKSTMGV